jgi:hypothetical protein
VSGSPYGFPVASRRPNPPVAFRFVSFQQAHAARTRIPCNRRNDLHVMRGPPEPAGTAYVRTRRNIIGIGRDTTQRLQPPLYIRGRGVCE